VWWAELPCPCQFLDRPELPGEFKGRESLNVSARGRAFKMMSD